MSTSCMFYCSESFARYETMAEPANAAHPDCADPYRTTVDALFRNIQFTRPVESRGVLPVTK
jgi:hypothetical protein